MRLVSVVVVFLALFVLHQDFWNWNSDRLVWGFMPMGLAYHAGYSIVAAIFWWIVSRTIWPHHLEAWADGENGVTK